MAIVNQDQANVEKVVLAGMKIMYDKDVFPKFMSGFQNTKASVSDALAAQAAGLIKILDDQSKGQIPKRIIVPAAVMLLIEMADFLTKAKMAKPTKQDLADAIKKLTAIILKVYAQAPATGAPASPQPPGAAQPAAPAQPPALQPGLVQGAM